MYKPLRNGRFQDLVGTAVASALLLALAAAPAHAKVGIASVVNGEPTAQPPQEAQRVLHIGNDMVADETVVTKSNDRAHIVFLDGSTLTVGPNSTIVIDKFVFDPGQQSGTLSLRASRGVFRYVGGVISKNAEVEIKTPSATLGIRGGIATVTVEPSGATRANFLFGGSLSITSQGVTQVTTQPSTQVAALAGAPPTPPAPIPPGILQQINRAFTAPAGTTAPGTTANAVSTALTGSTFSQGNSGMAPAEARAAIPSTQQAQLGVGKAMAAAATNAAGNQQQAGTNSGPLATGGPLQTTGPLQAAGPLQASGPTQAAGSLQNAGPLATATPFQQTGPISTDSALTLAAAQPGLAIPNAPAQQPALGTLAAGVAAGNGTALQQLQNLLSSPQGTTPASLSTLVSSVTAASSPTSTSSTTTTSTSSSTTTTTLSAPTVLAPTVYSSTSVASVSPN